MEKQKLYRILIITSFAIAFAMLMSFREECVKLEDGKYKVVFKTKGYSSFELIINNNHFTKTAKDGQLTRGIIEWKNDCIFIMSDTLSENKGDSLAAKIENGLGKACIQLLGKKGKSIKFRTTRTANLNIVLNEGRFIKIE